MRDNEELMRNLKISDNSGHLVPYSARKPLGPIEKIRPHILQIMQKLYNPCLALV